MAGSSAASLFPFFGIVTREVDDRWQNNGWLAQSYKNLGHFRHFSVKQHICSCSILVHQQFMHVTNTSMYFLAVKCHQADLGRPALRAYNLSSCFFILNEKVVLDTVVAAKNRE
jgi:hypothetical protein